MIQPFILYPLCVIGFFVMVGLVLAFKVDHLNEINEKEKDVLKTKTKNNSLNS